MQMVHLQRWMRPNRSICVLLGVLWLASCAKPLPKPQPPAPPPPPHQATVRPKVHAGWSFQTEHNVCLATAVAGRFRLAITVHRKEPIRLVVALPYATAGRPVARFRGPAGAWSASGWHAGEHEIVFNLGHDMDSLSRVLMLLSGGAMDLDSPAKDLPIFFLSASGADGQRWFGCARWLVI